MTQDIRVKICGLRDEAAIATAASAGAAYVGFTFFEKSPRSVTLDQAAALALTVPVGVAKVALVVNPDDETLDAITSRTTIDMIQLHGAETPERVAEVKSRYGLPVMKAVGVGAAEDLPKLEAYGRVADQLLVDAKPPKDGVLPGGNGLTFDWSLIAGRKWPVPWMLAGGLNADNVGEAIARTGTRQVDLSSGVESAPGVKDPAMINAFFDAVRLVPTSMPKLR